jgi:glyoxylase-like metal-dependent hydrolase (beta-lactamase superfamily II)
MHDGERSESVVTIDTLYIHPQRAAAYLIVEGGRAAFVDNNTRRALPALLGALAAQGLGPADVDYAIVTHVHLDHAAGTSALLEACPNAVALVHPRGARHIVDPRRLVASSMRVYGENVFQALYGTIEPVAEERVRAVEDGQELAFGGRVLRFLHTPGHARHHICIYDSGSNGIFTGDAFGTAYPALQHGTRPYLLCSAPPTDFDAEAARETARRIADTGAERAYLTHFGPFAPVREGAEELLRSIDDMEGVRRDAVALGLKGDALRAFCAERVREAVLRQMDRCGIQVSPDEYRWLEPDIHMNTLGLAHAARAAIAS